MKMWCFSFQKHEYSYGIILEHSVSLTLEKALKEHGDSAFLIKVDISIIRKRFSFCMVIEEGKTYEW